MVESETSGLSEKIMLEAVKFGHEKFVPIIEMQLKNFAKKLVNLNGKSRKSITLI